MNKKVQIIEHKPTGTFWVNDSNWQIRIKEEAYNLGEIEYDTEDVFAVKEYMHKIGYELCRRKELPMSILGLSKLTPEELKEMIDKAKNNEEKVLISLE